MPIMSQKVHKHIRTVVSEARQLPICLSCSLKSDKYLIMSSMLCKLRHDTFLDKRYTMDIFGEISLYFEKLIFSLMGELEMEFKIRNETEKDVEIVDTIIYSYVNLKLKNGRIKNK